MMHNEHELDGYYSNCVIYDNAGLSVLGETTTPHLQKLPFTMAMEDIQRWRVEEVQLISPPLLH